MRRYLKSNICALFLTQMLLCSCGPSGPTSNSDDLSASADVLSTDKGAFVDTAPPSATYPKVYLRKLTRYEYNNTLRDLLKMEEPLADLFIPDVPLLGFENNPSVNALTTERLFDYVQASEDIAAFLSKDVPQLTKCNPQSSDARECLKSFLYKFVTPIYRKPLTKIQRNRILKIFDEAYAEKTFDEAFEAAMQAVFVSPHFLYRMEKGPEEDQAEDELAEPYDLATRLSYFFWASTPDEALLEAAAKGELNSPEQVYEQAIRLLQDPRSRSMFAHFGRQWLAISLPELHPAFVEGSATPEILEETARFMNHVVFEGTGTLEGLFLSPYSIMNTNVAEHYGGINLEVKTYSLKNQCELKALNQGIGQQCSKGGGECPAELSCLADLFENWFFGAESICVMSTNCTNANSCSDGNLSCCSIAAAGGPTDVCLPKSCTGGICESGGAATEGWQKVDYESEQRMGFLTQASLLTAHADIADPILAPIRRGRFVREQLLCQPVSSPPPDVPIIDPTAVDGNSVQALLAAHTSDPNCAGCHKLMDPIGFVFEHFDATGHFQHLDAQGLEIQAQGEFFGTQDMDGPIDDLEDLANKLAQSEQVQDCFLRQWWRFVFGRLEGSDDAEDLGFLLEEFQNDGGNIQKLLLNFTQTDAFLKRRKEAP